MGAGVGGARGIGAVGTARGGGVRGVVVWVVFADPVV